MPELESIDFEFPFDQGGGIALVSLESTRTQIEQIRVAGPRVRFAKLMGSGHAWLAVSNEVVQSPLQGRLRYFGEPPQIATVRFLGRPVSDDDFNTDTLNSAPGWLAEATAQALALDQQLRFDKLQDRIAESELDPGLKAGRLRCLRFDALTSSDILFYIQQQAGNPATLLAGAFPGVLTLFGPNPIDPDTTEAINKVRGRVSGMRKQRLADAQDLAAYDGPSLANESNLPAMVGALQTVGDLLSRALDLTFTSAGVEDFGRFLMRFANGEFAFWAPQGSLAGHGSGYSPAPPCTHTSFNAEPDSSVFAQLSEFFLLASIYASTVDSGTWRTLYHATLPALEVFFSRYGPAVAPRKIAQYNRCVGHRPRGVLLGSGELNAVWKRYFKGPGATPKLSNEEYSAQHSLTLLAGLRDE